ncbi:HNH endonuclease [Limimaricola variabilis]|uniref:HNH endonuclease n=1 Tax=Limimaricola variabilis TaxID=1492771 RepID=UPI00389955FA
MYLFARASGRCEGCNDAAPFLTARGRPYLEAHHIRRMTDGGPDDPRFMIALCPNCHRRAHYGRDAKARSEELLRIVSALESRAGQKVRNTMAESYER